MRLSKCVPNNIFPLLRSILLVRVPLIKVDPGESSLGCLHRRHQNYTFMAVHQPNIWPTTSLQFRYRQA